MNRHAGTFESYYQASSDPWGYRTRWYEERKRAVTLAALTRPHFPRVWEIGCSIGELTASLSTRCSDLLATDGNPQAVRAAKRRLADYPHVRVERAWHPHDWPDRAFDLIVFSELGYYLDEADLRQTGEKLRASLQPAGLVVACHWRHPIEDCTLGGDDVHTILGQSLRLPRVLAHVEDDFILEAWCEDSRSVARQEGLV